MRFSVLGLLLLATASVSAVAAQQPPKLLNVIVTMKDERPRALTDMKAIRRRLRKRHVACDADADGQARSADGAVHVAEMVNGLVEHAQASHAPIVNMVNEAAPNTTTTTTTATSLWITNEVSVRDATPELIEQLRAMPEVGEVRIARVARLPRRETYANVSAVSTSSETTAGKQNNTWALERIQAQLAWQRGFQGLGMRVATADSGVIANHASIAGRMLPKFGWFDAVDGSTTPVDPNGHGTSVMSILAGTNGLGVAPQATWIACRACDATGDCDETWMLACAQFLLCPVNANQQMDCATRPHVINMSWNYDAMDERLLEPVIDAWLAAGIVPVFSNGNRGPKCKTVRSPADWTSGITVGATTSADDIAPMSARGPNMNGQIKPDLSAPGMDVVAAHNSASSATVSFMGTSASAPFVSGAVALMLQANSKLSPLAIKKLLTSSTDQTPLVPHIADSCFATAATDTAMRFPNNVYGHGRLNVDKAVTLATHATSRR